MARQDGARLGGWLRLSAGRIFGADRADRALLSGPLKTEAEKFVAGPHIPHVRDFSQAGVVGIDGTGPAVAVSYTHLDVYKRQVNDHARFKRFD